MTPIWYQTDQPNGKPQYITTHRGWTVKVWLVRTRWSWTASKAGQTLYRSGYVKVAAARTDAIKRIDKQER